MSTEPVDITEIVEGFDKEIPCDWARYIDTVHGPARWRAVRVRCDCGYGSTVKLICDPCKEAILSPDLAVRCIGCGAVSAPASLIIKSIEAL